ncbi:glycosyltransferase [Chitinibacter bivalviorum]|uniref:Glycosyltransferase n=1 Tax=Chitinibacter bivalviorum TaxID=2739434 RepID=A0A7H9BL73_9NEIS|nr:glycosyltransferase [Chitinibacter bivalviorum]QLG89427.1 glycosyltransferase [Chitinibacter bivalviorum]
MLLSVVMTFKCPHPDHLAEAIESILTARLDSFSALELILVDDGSVEDQAPLIARLAAQAPTHCELKHIVLPANQGVSCARNIGMAAASGDWIAMHDADDLSLPNRFEVSARYLITHPAVIAVSGDLQVFWDDAAEGEAESLRLFPLEHDEICVDNLFYCAMAQPALMINRALWLASGVQYTPKMDMAQDWDFLIRLAQHGQLANLGEPLVRYRQHHKQRTSRVNGEAPNLHVQGIWQRQLAQLGVSSSDAILKTHSLLSPYWLWVLNDLTQAWEVLPAQVDEWYGEMLSGNAQTGYVCAKLLRQKLSRIQHNWRAWRLSADPATQLQRLI